MTPSSTYLLSARGRAQFPSAIVRESPGGPIVRIESVPSNNPAAYQLYRGFDIGVQYRLPQTPFGAFNFSVDVTKTEEIGSDSGLGGGYFNNIGLYNNPDWRGNASVGWRRDNLSAEIWFAPSLQYLPVRIRLTLGDEAEIDLRVESVEQR